MGLWGRLRSFHRRRIAIPVGSEALVVDIGSGDKPHWRADVLVDHYPDSDHAAQRSGGSRARIDRVFFDADAARLPFDTGIFDFAICSHMLEHVPDTAAVLDEISRVARAGYIEVPEAASAKIVDFPSHLWWCRLEDDVLVFQAKTTPWFDSEIHDYLVASGLERRLGRLLDADLDHRVISLHWEGSIPYRVEGVLDPALVERAHQVDADQRRVQGIVSRLVTAAWSAPYRWRHRSLRRRGLRLDDLLAEPWRRGDDEALEPGIYRVRADQVMRDPK
jgi:SAM-dependent methyltransferase